MASVGRIKQWIDAINADTRQQALSNFQRFASMRLVTAETEPAVFRAMAVLIECMRFCEDAGEKFS